MIGFSNAELKNLPYAVDLIGDKDYFEVIHTHEDGSTEICKVTSGTDSDGYKLWSIGAYTTNKGNTYMAVLAGKVLKNVTVKT